jgi:hypothetical protein
VTVQGIPLIVTVEGINSLEDEDTIIPTLTVLPLLGSNASQLLDAVAVMVPPATESTVEFQELATAA